MTHPLTPPPELVQQWGHNAHLSGAPHTDEHWAYEQHIATQAAQWGADQELEACLRLVEIDAGEDAYDFARYIRAARRPKPQTLSSVALQMLSTIERDARYLPEITDTIRRALEGI